MTDNSSIALDRRLIILIARYPSLLVWLKRTKWTALEASLLAFSIEPRMMPNDWKECARELCCHLEGFNFGVDFSQLHYAILEIIESKKPCGTNIVRNPMSPREWMEFFVKSGIVLPVELFKAFKTTHPDFPWSAGLIRDGRILEYVAETPPPCSACSEKSQEIAKLNEKIKTLDAKKSSVNPNKTLQVIAGLIEANYPNRGKEVTQVMIRDLETVGCKIDHETLKKYLNEGREQLEP